MEEMMEKYDSVGIEMEGRADTSFASEALIEKEDPTANTKTIT
jgi:hypothetical protein